MCLYMQEMKGETKKKHQARLQKGKARLKKTGETKKIQSCKVILSNLKDKSP